MKHAILLVFGLAAAAATAQPTDTIDWQRYYPLAVGNLWEYHDAEAFGDQFRHTLVSDTTVGEQRYFRRRTDRAIAVVDQTGPDTLRFTSFDFVRYDDGGGVVAVADIQADAVAVVPCAEAGFERDLRLGFGARLECDPPPPSLPDADSVFVEGEYDVTWAPDVLTGTAEQVSVAAVKRYTVGGVIFSTFVADVGPVRTGNLWGPSLHYAIVGGVEYGAAEFAVSSEASTPRASAFEVRVLGNPSRSDAAFDLRAVQPDRVRLRVYDVLGREAWASEIVVGTDWRRAQVPAAALASGRYVLSVSGTVGRVAVPFTVVR